MRNRPLPPGSHQREATLSDAAARFRASAAEAGAGDFTGEAGIMQWNDWNGFWAMGGYAGFVWGSYGVTLVAFVVELALLRARRRAADAAARSSAALRAPGSPP
jgi:heme exporter protein CcmD